MEDLLFEPELLHKLEKMGFALKKLRGGRYSGQHRSPRKGQSVEFADYRTYASGDDWRQVDWYAYARLERLFVKLFMEENDLLINLFVDTSASMNWGDGGKLRLGKQLAGALGYLALVNQERVGVVALKEGAVRTLPVQRSRASITRLWGFLQELPPGGSTDLNLALRQAAKAVRGPGISIVISDLLSPSGFEEGLKYLQYLNQQVVVLHVLDSEEREPKLLGNFELVDCETGQVKEVNVTPVILNKYRQAVQAFLAGVRQFCSAREIAYHTIDPKEDLENVLLRSLRAAGVLV